MSNLIKKIMFAGWCKPVSFPRKQIERELEPKEPVRVSFKRHRKACKRNHNQPHEYVMFKETHLNCLGTTYQHFKCTKCGKQDWRQKK